MSKSPWWIVMAAVLIAEAIFIASMIYRSGQLLFSLIASSSDGSIIALELSIVVILILALIWVLATARGAVKRLPWSRSSSLTIQVLFIAAATGVLQGIIGTTTIGLAMLFVAILGLLAAILLAVSKPNEQV